MYNFLNPDTLKGKKFEVEHDLANTMNLLLTELCSMFKYENVPDTIDKRFFTTLEMVKLLHGMAGVDDDLNIYVGNFGGEPDNYGQGGRFVGATVGGIKVIDTEKNNILIAKNNPLYLSDYYTIYKYADILTQIDVSIKTNIKYSRYLPIPKVKDDKLKVVVDTIYKNLDVGKPTTILNKDNLLNDIEGIPDIELVDFSDVSNADKIQYLVKCYDDITRRFWAIFGHSTSSSLKMAQQTVDEISKNDSICSIYPHGRLKCAKEFIDEFNTKFGYNITVDFSDAWKCRVDEMEVGESNEVISAEYTETDTTEE